MNTTNTREVAEHGAATSSANMARHEPSHIHVPRPSRMLRSRVTPAGELAAEAAELGLALALDEAA